MTVNEGAKIHHLIGMQKWFICRMADIECLLSLHGCSPWAKGLKFVEMIYSCEFVKKSKIHLTI